MKNKKNKTRTLLTVLITALIVVAAGTGYIFVSNNMKDNEYTASIQQAEKYIELEDYDQAIIAYQDAISTDPSKAEAYLGLADIYEEQGNVSKLRAVLNRGYEMTGHASIRERLSTIETVAKKADTDDDGNSVKDLANASANISMDGAFVQKMINYTFSDYEREFGRLVSADFDSEGYLEVRHENLDGICYYKNASDNREIVDETRKTPYDSAMPEKISLETLDVLFRNFDGAVSLEKMQIIFGTKVTTQSDEERNYIEDTSEDIVFKIETDENGNVVSNTAWNEIVLPLANTKVTSSEGVVSGVVLDAVSGDGISDAKLTFTPTGSSGSKVTVSADSSGLFEASLEPGDYSIKISASGYITDTFEITVESGNNYSGEQFVLSPELSGEARIVLEWNAQPYDLDSHLMGTTDSGDSVHVYYGNKTSDAAELDIDDTSSYGPETTTIHDLNGVYTFTVVDFRRTGTMAANGATVKIYLPGESPVEVNLSSSSGVVDEWTVCKIDHGSLEIINSAGSELGY